MERLYARLVPTLVAYSRAMTNTARRRPDRTVDRFDEDPTRSFTLAASMYTDPAVFAEEKERIFWRTWQFVGHESEVAERGSFVTADIAGQRVFIIRSDDGELRAFFNVCQHRGHALLEGRGTAPTLITCPYHAWAYGRDGTLQGARMSDRMADFNFDDFTLPAVAVEVFCGLLFVNLDPDARPMAEVYPGAAERVLALHPDPSALVEQDDSVFDIAANWKNVGDNLLECYHCHPAHKGFVDLIDMSGYVNETYENWSIQSGPANLDNDVYAITSGTTGFASLYLWPSVSIGALPGHSGLFLFHFTPLDVELTRQTLTYYAPTSTPTEAEKHAMAFFDDVLGPEDVALVENVQVGLRSLGYHQGRFICIPDRPEISEHAVHHFHSMVRAALS